MWREDPSRKIDALITILQHHLASDARPPLMVKGDKLIPTASCIATSLDSDTSTADPDKFVVYCAFPSSNNIVIQALKLHGIKCLSISGKMSPSERQNVINGFKHGGPGDPRVLFLSPCGTVGLNLPCANHLIIMASTTILRYSHFWILIIFKLGYTLVLPR